jgi:hypothetical protein
MLFSIPVANMKLAMVQSPWLAGPRLQPAAHGNVRFGLHPRLDSRAGSKENLRTHVAPWRIFVQ